MNFIEAVKVVNNGGKVRLNAWNKRFYITDNPDRFTSTSFVNHNGYPCNVSIQEMLKNDWEIYKEEPKLHTFEEALKAFKNGKTIFKFDPNIQDGKYKLNKKFNKHNFHDSLFFGKDVLTNNWVIED